MKEINGGTQMRDVWTLPAIAKWEKTCGKHPTQKPLPLLGRIIMASTKPNDWILDPFTGASTTGIAANLFDRRFLGIDKEENFLQISKKRRIELDNYTIRQQYKYNINKYSNVPLKPIWEIHEPKIYYGIDLPVTE